jgi:hypothetical protein
VGIRSVNSITEFSPLLAGRLQDTRNSNASFDSQFNYHYPLSLLALSNASYTTLFEGDLGIGSKRNIVLPYDPPKADRYLDYVRNGSTLVVINSNNSFDGGVGKLMQIRPHNVAEFVSITKKVPDEQGERLFLDVSGFARNITSALDSKINSYYVGKNHSGAFPFTLEKDYGQGKIIYINAHGYFDAIKRSDHKKFLSLGQANLLIGIPPNSNHSNSFHNLPPPRFVGQMNGTGDVRMTSQSWYLPISDEFFAKKILLLNHTGSSAIINQEANVKNLTITGPFTVSINSSSFSYVPYLSQNGYTPVAFIRSPDITFDLAQSTKLQVEYSNFTSSRNNKMVISGSNVTFKDVTSIERPIGYNAIFFMKNPQINVDGETRIQQLYARNPDDPSMWLANGQGFQNQGNLSIKISHVEANPFGQESQEYVTYLDLVQADNYNTNDPQRSAMAFKLPGDVSDYAKENGIQIPIWKAVLSDVNNKVLYTFLVVTAATLYLSWPRLRKI